MSPEQRERSDRSGGDILPGSTPDPEVPEVARRRTFSQTYKLRILEEADRCKKNGDLGVLLRREGLYSSTLTNWRRWRNQMRRSSNPKPSSMKELRNENARLQRENRRLNLRLKHTEGLVEIQKKALALQEALEKELNENSE